MLNGFLNWSPLVLLIGSGLFFGLSRFIQSPHFPSFVWCAFFAFLCGTQAWLTWSIPEMVYHPVEPHLNGRHQRQHGQDLRQVTVQVWNQATPRDRLTTAYYWIQDWHQHQHIYLEIHTQNDFWPWAEALMKCVQYQAMNRPVSQPMGSLSPLCQSRQLLQQWQR